MTNCLPICVLCDEGYAMHLGAMLYSLMCNCRETTEIEVHILGDGISNNTRSRIEGIPHLHPSFQIVWHDITHLLTTIVHGNQDWPASLYKRLMVASILKELDRVLLLDADTIILKDPIDLFQQDLGEGWLGGILDPLGRRNNIRLGISPEMPYVNFGVLLLDLNAWRKHNVEALLLETLHNGPSFKYMDQDVLNLTLHRHIVTFAPHWNSQFLNDRYTPKSRDDFKNPSIIHYVTKEKPWITLSAIPRKEYYIRYVLMSPWGHEWKEKVKRERRTLSPWLYRLRHFFKEGFQIHIKHGEYYVKFAGIKLMRSVSNENYGQYE